MKYCLNGVTFELELMYSIFEGHLFHYAYKTDLVGFHSDTYILGPIVISLTF